jgi:CheY-like chemotaxis protein/predicted regulator of Ras-like GTPase activity (Roadblock/LC7/MglB family)
MSKPWHILIVLDDEYLDWNIVNSLQIDGYLVKAAKSGTEAVHLLWAEEYDIVVSDQKMPDTDGFELLQWIRTYRPGTRMIMVGMPGSSVTRNQALESGVVGYLEKPLDLHTLKEELRRLLQQTGFSANLDSFDLLDVIQIVNMSRKTIAMVVNTGLEEQGLLGFQVGELVWAEYGILHGEEAFFALAAHKNGTITHRPWNAQIKPNVTQPLSRLIFQSLQYRSKYEAFRQLTGEQAAIAPSAITPPGQLPDDDSPFIFVEPVPADGHRAAASHYALETPVPAQLMATEATEWWQEPASHEHPNKKNAPQPVTGDQVSTGAQSAADGLHVGNDLNGSGTGITPVKAHKTPARQRVDLPSWLMDQPTQFEMPAMPPSTLTSTNQDPAASVVKASPAEWQAPPPVARSVKQLPVEPGSNAPKHRKSSPEWQLPEGSSEDQEKNLISARKTDDFAVAASQQKRDNSALIASLQTLGYSISGFIATAVVNMDGLPVAQVAMDDLDISPVCEYCSNIMQGTIRGLDQAALGHFEDTIITSTTHFVLLRLIGDKGDRFQVLITTREADPVESLEIMANIEPALESALLTGAQGTAYLPTSH